MSCKSICLKKVAVLFAVIASLVYSHSALAFIENHAAANHLHLIESARDGDVIGVSQLIRRGANVNGADSTGKTPLMVAAEYGCIEVLDRLLQEPWIGVNQIDQDGDTALTFAAAKGWVEVVERLLRVPGVEVFRSDRNGDTALMFAADEGHVEVVERLLQVPGVNVNGSNYDGRTALMLAADSGHVGVVDRLLRVPGIDLNLKDDEGFTALIFAADQGFGEVVERLLQEPGIQVNEENQFSMTALRSAVCHGHVHVAERLLRVPEIEVSEDDLLEALYQGHSAIIQKLEVAGVVAQEASERRGIEIKAFTKSSGLVAQCKLLGTVIEKKEQLECPICCEPLTDKLAHPGCECQCGFHRSCLSGAAVVEKRKRSSSGLWSCPTCRKKSNTLGSIVCYKLPRTENGDLLESDRQEAR